MTSISTSPLYFLIATISGRYLAFSAEATKGVLSNEEAMPFRDPVLQEKVYRVVDLNIRLNLPNERLGDGTRMVLLANESCRGSVRVDKVHGMLKIQRSQVLPFPAQFRGPEQRWYLGMIPFNRSVALILNIAWVLDDQVRTVMSKSERQAMDPMVAVEGATESKN